MHALTYRCPHCKTTTDVTADRIEDTVICANPKCRKPFVCDTPVGQLVGTRELARETAADLQAAAPTAAAEETLLVTHPAAFRSQPFLSLALVVAIAAGIAGLMWWHPRGEPGFAYASGAVGLLGLAWLVGRAIALRFTRLTVTNKRTMLRRGLLTKHTAEVRHNDVHLLKVDQRFLDRVLNIGRISVSSAAGQGEPEIVVRGVPRPNDVVAPIRGMQS